MRLINIKLVLFLLLPTMGLNACSDPEVEVPILIKQLSSQDSGVRNKAALRLGSYGKDAVKAVKPLARLLRDKNGGVRSSAAFALRKIDTPEARKALDSYKK